MREKTFVLAYAILLVAAAPLTAATSQNDAGLGGDAPNERDLAASIPTGDLEGMVEPALGDLADWFFVCTYVTGVLKLIIEDVGLEVDIGGQLARTPLDLQIDPCIGPIGIRALGDSPVSYRMRLVDVPAADFAVTSLVVHSPPLVSTGALSRRVDVVVANVAGIPDHVLVVVSAQTSGVTRSLEERSFFLQPGEKVEFTVALGGIDPALQTTIRATALPAQDVSWDNNERTELLGLVAAG